MPELTLSTADERRFEDAQEALLSPLEHGHVDAWRSTVNASMKRLLGADIATFALPVEESERMYSEDFEPGALRSYDSMLRPFAEPIGAYDRIRRLGVANRRMIFGPHLPDLYRSTYYNDFVVPVRGFDSLLATVEIGGGEMAQLLLHHERPRGRRFGRRGLEILRLLYPAFVAGVRAAMRLRKARKGILRWVDALDEPLAVVGGKGAVEHVNPPLRRLLKREPEPGRVLAEVGRMARGMAPGAGNGQPDGRLGLPVRRIRASRGVYRARAVLGPPLPHRPAILVMLSNGSAPLPSPDALRRRHGLTARQAEVALLLGERRTNAEIANRLSVSEHTARRHTEKVLLKLGIHSRTEVRRAISEPDPRD